LLREFAIAQEFHWTLREIRAMEGYPHPDLITAEEWLLWLEISRLVAAHRADQIRRH